MKKLNVPLMAGGIIIGLIIFVMIFPQVLTHFNPYVIEGVKASISKAGSIVIQGPPYAPSKENILGTDSLGRDELSLIIYGTRLTIMLGIFTVLGRFLVALPVGIAAGFGNSICKSAVSLFGILFSAIPALIISVVVLKINFFLGLFKAQSILAFVIVLTVVGWARLASLVKERVENILSQPFITGEKAVGKSGIKIAIENVLPHLAPELIVLFFMEMALVLSMIMELGFFGVYVGNLRVVLDTSGGVIQTMKISYEPEWASMLSTSINSLRNAPWTVFAPAVTFFISIFGFNLFGEGLREKLQNKNSKLIVYTRRIFSLKIFTKKVLRTTTVIACAVLVAAGIHSIKGYYTDRSETKQALSYINYDFKDKVLIGSKEAEYTAEKLKSSLKQAGFKPIGNDYIQNYNIDKLYSAASYSLSINNKAAAKKLTLGRDFSMAGYGDYALSGDIYDARSTDMFNIKDYSVFDNKFVVFDEQVYSRDAIRQFTDTLGKKSKTLGVIDIIDSETDLPSVISTKSSGTALIYMTKKASADIEADSRIALNMHGCSLSGQGKNILGILPGSSAKLSKQAIIIGAGYNYMDYDKKNAVKKLKMMIEAAKMLHDSGKSQGRSIIIAFWDGNLTDSYAGVINYVNKPLYSLPDTILNIDLTGLNMESNTILMNSQQAPITRYFAWAFNHELEQNIKSSGIRIQEYISKKDVTEIIGQGPDPKEIMYYQGSVPTILTLHESEAVNTQKSKVEKNFTDILVSTITNINY